MTQEEKIDIAIKATEEVFGISFEMLNTKTRKREYAIPRQVWYWLMRMTGLSHEKTTERLNQNHSTSIHAVKAVKNYIETSSDFCYTVQKLCALCCEQGWEQPAEAFVLVKKHHAFRPAEWLKDYRKVEMVRPTISKIKRSKVKFTLIEQ
jgi:hypothetical protein